MNTGLQIVYKFFFILNFFYFKFRYWNLFNFFNKIFFFFNFFNILYVENCKKEYIFNYIQFKKQNSLLKKKYNFINNLNPIFFKTNIRKKMLYGKYKQCFLQAYVLQKDLLTFIKKRFSFHNSMHLDGKKKLKKRILINRFYLRFLQVKLNKRALQLTKLIHIEGKLALGSNVLGYQFSLLVVLKILNIFKFRLDAIQLVKNSNLFINKVVVSNINIVLVLGDLVEFVINQKKFNYILYLAMLLSKNALKLKNRLWFKLKTLKVSKSIDKTITKLWEIGNYKMVQDSIEIDYFSLSFLIIYKNLNIKKLDIDIKKILVMYLFRLYAWK